MQINSRKGINSSSKTISSHLSVNHSTDVSEQLNFSLSLQSMSSVVLSDCGPYFFSLLLELIRFEYKHSSYWIFLFCPIVLNFAVLYELWDFSHFCCHSSFNFTSLTSNFFPARLFSVLRLRSMSEKGLEGRYQAVLIKHSTISSPFFSIHALDGPTSRTVLARLS